MKRMGTKNRSWQAGLKLSLVISLVPFATGCLQPGSGTFSGSSAVTATPSGIPGGAMAAQVVFTTNTTTGSFIAPTNSGTPAIVGQGLQVSHLFNPDGSSLAPGGVTDPNWPAWISSIEIGITGPNNQYTLPGSATPNSSNTNCARFATTSEAPGGGSQALCTYGTTTNVPCGATAGSFRVSEADCNFGSDANSKGVGIGNGTGADNVYIRANFNRAGLGPQENILMVVNYAASNYYQADQTPTDCFTNYNGVNLYNTLPNPLSNFIVGPGPWFSAGTTLTPEACSDFAWKVYLHHGPTEGAVQPFTPFVPPVYSYVAGNANKTSATPNSTKQFVIPLSGDQNLSTVQLSRVFSTLKSTDGSFMGACDPSSGHLTTGANSPLCAGIIFNTITFFRM